MPQQLADYEALGLPTKSDGIVTSYPTNTTKPPGDGPWEYFRPVQDQEVKDVIWRTKTAKFVAQHFKLDGNGLERILYPGLPERYKLFEHVKCHSVSISLHYLLLWHLQCPIANARCFFRTATYVLIPTSSVTLAADVSARRTSSTPTSSGCMRPTLRTRLLESPKSSRSASVVFA
jgi:hypothetical protein